MQYSVSDTCMFYKLEKAVDLLRRCKGKINGIKTGNSQNSLWHQWLKQTVKELKSYKKICYILL